MIFGVFKKKDSTDTTHVPVVYTSKYTIDIPEFNWTDARKFKYIVWHHSESPDGVERNWEQLKKYHTSFRVDYCIVSEEEFYRRRREGEGKRFEKPWKDIGYYLQCGTRTYEYQDTAKSYIGFRCVRTFLGREFNDQGGSQIY